MGNMVLEETSVNQIYEGIHRFVEDNRNRGCTDLEILCLLRVFIGIAVRDNQIVIPKGGLL